MKKLKKCVGALCCAGVLGCTGASQDLRPFPPPENCPPGAAQAMEKHGITRYTKYLLEFPVAEGSQVRLEVRDDRPPGSVEGKIYVVQGRFYARLTRFYPREGSPFPICMHLIEANINVPGYPVDREVNANVPYAQPVSSFP